MKNFIYIFSLLQALLALLLCGCADNDAPFRSVIPDEDDEYILAIKPLPIEGEEIPYGDSRALNPMSVDKENMIKQIAIFQYDAEDHLRQLKDNHGYFIYVDFTDAGNSDNTTTNFIPADKGYTRVTEKELPPLSSVPWTSTSSSLKTCVIANVSRSMVESALFPNGKNNRPADWAEFQNTSFDVPFLTEEEVEADKLVSGESELGHLKDIYMFGYYEGTVPPMGFTLGLGRTVARLKVTFSVEDTKKIDPDARFYAAVSNLGRQSSYFIKMDANSEPNISEAYLLDPERFDLSSGEAVIQFYGGPKVNEIINDPSEATTLLLWYVRPGEDGNYSTPDPTTDEWLGKAVKVPFGNAPKEGNYGIVRNTLYSFRLPLIFNSTGFGIEYMYSSTLRDKEASPLPWTATSWGVNLYMDGENDSHSDTGSSHLKVDWNDDSWKGKMIKFYYTYDTKNTYEESYCNAKFATDPANVQGWADLPGYSENIGLETTSGTFDIILTDDVLNQIRQDGELIVYGYHYTITMIEIWEEGYTSAAPVAGNFTFAIVNNNNEWDWEHRGYMDGTTEHPYALTLGSTNSKGSGFLISNLLNTSYDFDKKAKYGVVDYLIYNDEKTFKLVDKPYGKRQVQFDFSQLTYAVKTGQDEISGDYIMIVPVDTDGDNTNDNYALLPLQPTTGLSQDVIFYVTIPNEYEIGKKEGNDPEYFKVTSRTVPVKVSIADAFSHMLKPNKELQVASTGQSLDDILAQATSYTAEKKYYGELVNSTNVALNQLTRQTTGAYITAVNKNGSTVSDLSGFSVDDGKLEFPDDFIGTIYLHYDVASTVTSDDLVDYHYSDLTLPIKVDVIINYTDLASPNFPIEGVNFGGAGWDSQWNSESQTITYTPNGRGCGRGWWFDKKDLSEYAAIQIDFENLNPSETELQIIVEYTTGANTSSISSSEGPLTCEIDGERPVKQIYIIANKGATVKLTRVALGTIGGGSSDPTTEPANELPYVMDESWGPHYYKISAQDWSSQSPWKDAKAGDVLKATATNINDGAQGVFKIMGTSDSNANWVDLGSVSNLGNGITEFSVTLTEENITNLKKFGLAVGGIKYTLSDLTLIGTSSSSVNYAYRIKESDSNYGQGGEEAEGGKTLTLSSPSTLDLATLIAGNSSLTHQLVDIAGEEEPIAVASPNLTYLTSDENLKIEDGKLIPLDTDTPVTFSATLASPHQGHNIAGRNAVPISTTFTGTIDHTLTAQLKGNTAPTLYEGTTNIDNFLANWNFTISKTYDGTTIHSAEATISYQDVSSNTDDVTVNNNGTLTVTAGTSGTCQLTVPCTSSETLQSAYRYPSETQNVTIDFPYGGAPTEIPVWEGESTQLELTQTNAPDLLKNAKVGARVRAYVKDVNESGATGQFLSAWYQAYNGYDSIEISPSDEYIEMLIEDYMITEDSSKASIDRLGLVIKTTNCKVYKVTIIPAP